jgi:hypothetical protein
LSSSIMMMPDDEIQKKGGARPIAGRRIPSVYRRRTHGANAEATP